MPQRAAFNPTDLSAAQTCVLSAAVRFNGGEALPKRFKILNWGENIGRTTKSRIVVSEVTLSKLPAYQQATASERIGIDFEHQSVPGHPNYLPDPRDMAGHAAVEVVEGDGVYLSGIDYTPAGNRFGSNYPDVSGHVFLDADGNLLLVRSAALTQHGDVAGMEFSEAVAACAACPTLTIQATPTEPEKQHDMDTNVPDPVKPDFRAMLITLLGLTAPEGGEVSDEQIASAISAKADANGEPPAPAAEAALGARMDAFERRQILFEARQMGKVLPADSVLAGMTTVALSALVDGLPAGEVPTAPGAGTQEKPDPTAKEVALSAEDNAAMKALGLTPEQFRAAQS